VLRDRDELRQRLYVGLLHDLLTVRLDRAFGRAQFMRDLLVDLASNDELENLSFARRQCRNMGSHRVQLVSLITHGLMTRQRTLNRLQQIL
jgi:hypothetical protein